MINDITMKNNMDHLIQAALREDISFEDISTNSVIKEPRRASAQHTNFAQKIAKEKRNR